MSPTVGAVRQDPGAEQLALFEAWPRPVDAVGLADLDGLLAGPGQAVRRGATARLSVLVGERAEDAWRTAVLLAAFERLGLDGEATDGAVRTGWSAALAPLAARWVRGAVKQPPADLVLDGPRLRLWAVCAGTAVGTGGAGGYLLRLGPSDSTAWPGVGAALAAAGVAGVFVGPRADGPAYRVAGTRRLRRLAGLLGPPPPDAMRNNGWVSVS